MRCFKPLSVTSNPKRRQTDYKPTKKKKPAAHFSTFGFARHTSQPFAKPKELKFPHLTQTVDKMFSI
jgi:hypothetical protein